MTMATKQQRVRIGTPRSRTGCSTCRQRRIKCGEEVRGCLRCRNSGWQCPGYNRADQSQQVRAEHAMSRRPVAGTIVQETVRSPDILTYALPFKVPGGREERRALHYFNAILAGDMAGGIPSVFWSRTILQRCQSATPLRHAAAALGQLYMEYKATPASCEFQAEDSTIKLYARALRSLRNYIDLSELPDRAMVLMCSATFCCFELLRGDWNGASSHLDSALQILARWQYEASHASVSSPDEYGELITVFSRLDLEATLIDDSRKPVLRLATSEILECHPLTLEKLSATLFELLHSAFVFLVDSIPSKGLETQYVPPNVVTGRARFLQQLREWDLMADELERTIRFESQGDGAHTEWERTLATCRLQGSIVRLLLQHWLNDYIRAAAPSFEDEAARLLALAEIAVLVPADSHASLHAGGRRFSPHTGVIAPIFLLVVKVCDNSIRNTALELLRKNHGHREGFYDASSSIESVQALRCRATSLGLQPDKIALEWLSDEYDVIDEKHAREKKRPKVGGPWPSCIQ